MSPRAGPTQGDVSVREGVADVREQVTKRSEPGVGAGSVVETAWRALGEGRLERKVIEAVPVPLPGMSEGAEEGVN